MAKTSDNNAVKGVTWWVMCLNLALMMSRYY